MKIKILTAAISLSLVACVTTTADQSAEKILDDNYSNNKSVAAAKEVKTIAIAKAVALKESLSANNDLLITLEQIMSDPDWMGRSPQSWYWGDDNQTIFYKQKRAGSPLSDLYRQATLDREAEKVKLAQMHVVSDRNAQRNKANTHEVYTFEGNVFVKELASLDVQQLTYTSAYEYSTMFLNNGNVAYRVGNKFFEHDLSSNKIIELANLQLKKDPKDSEESQSYIASEQHDLIAYVALQKRNSELRKNQQEKLKAQNATLTKSDFYLGDNKRINHASLSPNGDKLIVSISSGESSQADSDTMPNYIADDGHIKAEKVRQRVADNRQYNDELFLLDLKSGQKFPLSYEVLPGADEDVLTSVKTENYQREGKVYQSKKSPRNIHVMQANSPIQWHENGKQVAVLLEAWDNKDRWLTTVNLMENKLESQHRLHDDAWINWSFNEFGWLKGDNTLYYLSEETGYSHLYSKNLIGKAKQLTRGQFEISDVSLTQDKSRFVFKANKKHPGIYEIYQVDIKSGQFSALTDLGGMNDYALSPDDSTLLIEHSTVAMPPELYVKALKDDATAIRLTHTVSEKFLSMPWTAPSVVAVPSSYQDEPVYSRVYLPKDYDKTADKNRAVMFSHGAGYLQNSHLGWSGYFREYMFHSMLVQQGYVVIDMDYRASAGYGRDWRTAIYRHMGKPEVQDMRDGVNWLVDNANVDRQRIGTYGGSYGGFLTLMSMFTQPDLFQSGSALRLVSDWAYYNHGYTSNILNTPGDDAIAYERSSPIYFAEGLEKPLLINAPMVDDNVFFQDTVRLVQRLIELEKQNFETAIYPVEPHGFVQPSSWLDEYRRIYKLFENTL
ncbi:MULTISPECIES: prolyl oligopeptidase family serine peptidase [unclassified Colwellia]|jgi:dipeptidyl aminopeptidase/acylaminoacyl peptidase|uniref:S9 family peptidase n=1 Tax=unclassified Colwellia TaxID=196834 RepID=UPI0015F587D3|nr:MULTISPECIES: prolyl oligopeptidase family serine peptidase [unclassified Colwellia]MBA6253267.1 S9 family peptidase [Colwellia sp. MB3u-55]MBA6397886.1 S9 family peptidase [Colwellia sp. BRX10-4]